MFNKKMLWIACLTVIAMVSNERVASAEVTFSSDAQMFMNENHPISGKDGMSLIILGTVTTLGLGVLHRREHTSKQKKAKI
ncbi:MAG: hypothetical protein F6K16_19440 [Symploca sp. SIO2B6]|nr:hypothetical protein [Symploca sp. SIO2B6]